MSADADSAPLPPWELHGHDPLGDDEEPAGDSYGEPGADLLEELEAERRREARLEEEPLPEWAQGLGDGWDDEPPDELEPEPAAELEPAPELTPEEREALLVQLQRPHLDRDGESWKSSDSPPTGAGSAGFGVKFAPDAPRRKRERKRPAAPVKSWRLGESATVSGLGRDVAAVRAFLEAHTSRPLEELAASFKTGPQSEAERERGAELRCVVRLALAAGARHAAVAEALGITAKRVEKLAAS